MKRRSNFTTLLRSRAFVILAGLLVSIFAVSIREAFIVSNYTDQVKVNVAADGGLMFMGNWNGAKPVNQLLGGGNLQVR